MHAGWLHVVACSGAAIVGGGGVLVDANQEMALVNGVELVHLAYTEARTMALRAGEPTRLDIVPGSDRIVVSAAHADGRRKGQGVREVVPPAVSVRADVSTLCFDARGRPLVNERCQAHRGSISVETLTGEATLRLDGRGHLIR